MENILKGTKSAKIKVKSAKTTKDTEKKPLHAVINGVCTAYAITAAVFIIYALLLTYTGVTEKNISFIVILTTIIAVVTGGFLTSRGVTEKGYLWGLAMGAAYAVILVVISSIVAAKPALTMGTLTIVVVSLLGGALGGMLGINTSR